MPNVEIIEKKYFLIPVDEHNSQRNSQQGSRQENSRKRRNSNIFLKDEHKEKNMADITNTNVTLLFGLDKISGEAEAMIFDKNNNTSRTVNFEEVTKANDKIIERRGVIFDKRL